MRIVVVAIRQRALEIGKTTALVGQRVLFDGRRSIIVRKAISFFGGAPLRLNCLGRAAAVGGEVAIVALFFLEPEQSGRGGSVHVRRNRIKYQIAKVAGKFKSCRAELFLIQK